MQIIGHRGAAGLAPENTVKGFEAAIVHSVDWIEFDVRATKDSEIVVLHDPNTLRVARRWQTIKKTDLNRLKTLSIKDQKIPTLDEALASIYPKAKPMIEIKSSGCAEQVAMSITKLVNNGAKYSDFLVTSFNEKNLADIRATNPKIKVGLITSAFPYGFLKSKVSLSAVVFNHLTITKRLVELAKKNDLQVFAWTVDSPSRAKSLENLGIDGVITNRPDRFS